MRDHDVEMLLSDASDGNWWTVAENCKARPDGWHVHGLGTVRLVDERTSYDGTGDSRMYLVLAVEDENGQHRHYQINGWWDSWGSCWDGRLFAVTIETRTVTDFVAMNAC